MNVNDTIKTQKSLHFFPHFQCRVGLGELSMSVSNTYHASCDGISATGHEVHMHCSIKRI